jgi:hypothetical protein
MYSYVLNYFEEQKKTKLFSIDFSIEKNICDDPSVYSGVLPCTGKFQIGISSGDQCICQCLPGFTNTSTGCTGKE